MVRGEWRRKSYFRETKPHVPRARSQKAWYTQRTRKLLQGWVRTVCVFREEHVNIVFGSGCAGGKYESLPTPCY
jgi:hypothetical protein